MSSIWTSVCRPAEGGRFCLVRILITSCGRLGDEADDVQDCEGDDGEHDAADEVVRLLDIGADANADATDGGDGEYDAGKLFPVHDVLRAGPQKAGRQCSRREILGA